MQIFKSLRVPTPSEPIIFSTVFCQMHEMTMTFMTEYPWPKSGLYLNQWEFSQDFRKIISTLPSQETGSGNTYKVLITGT